MKAVLATCMFIIQTGQQGCYKCHLHCVLGHCCELVKITDLSNKNVFRTKHSENARVIS